MYTGGLENRPALLRRLRRLRPLWGNAGPSVHAVRSPRALQALLARANIPCPEIRERAEDVPPRGRWLVKPRRGAGGAGIRFWGGRDFIPVGRPVYFQEWLEGDSHAAVYVGDGRQARLLGVTRQLTGIEWLHARPFAYCGSVGPYQPSTPLRAALERLGNVLAGGAGLRGLFGVDFILRGEVPWPVEVNPRYTASVEVLEYALGIPALALHRDVFDPGPLCDNARPAGPVIGKAVLFARAPVVFPRGDPWEATLAEIPDASVWQVPAFADIPPAGQRIRRGRPILSFFTHADSAPACLDRLRQTASDLDRRLGND
jgi:predicted ATP-grasp superfamily ATP-dependent carboligase